MQKPRYTIYVVEAETGHPNEYYHAHLMKVREDAASGCILDYPPDVPFDAQEIHYFRDWPNSIYMKGKETTKRRCNDGLLLQPYISGDEDYIEALWQRTQKLLPLICDGKIPFDIAAPLPNQFNCRSGVEASLVAMGLRFVIDDPALPQTGLGKNLLERVTGGQTLAVA